MVGGKKSQQETVNYELQVRHGKSCYASAIRPANLSNFCNILWPEKAKKCPYKHNLKCKYPSYGGSTLYLLVKT